MKLREKISQIFHENASPKAVATGGSVGTFFGFFPFFPFFGLKTILSYTVSFFLKANTPVAILVVTLHDFLFPIYPVILRWEYQIGFWLLSNPHKLPPKLKRDHLNFNVIRHWDSFLRVGMPTLLGSLIFGIICAVIAYVVLYFIVSQRVRRAARLKNASEVGTESNL